MKIFLILFLNSIFLFNSYSYEINGRLENLGNKTVLDEGEAFDGYIRIWPLQSAIPEEMEKKLKESEFLGIFKVGEIKTIRFSENNNEVLEIYTSLIVTKPFNHNGPHIWSYKALNIPVEFINVEFGKRVAQINDFQSIPQLLNLEEETKSYLIYIALGVLGLVLFILYLFVPGLLEKRALKKADKRNKEEWKNLFQNAADREDFEKVYSEKDEWIKVIGIVTPPIHHFFSIINKHQYKREWNDEDRIEVSDAFDEIKNIFN